MTRPTEEEIRGQLDIVSHPGFAGSDYPEGVHDALRWVLGETDKKPMEELG